MARILPIQFERITDPNGDPISGGKLRIYDANTSNLSIVYEDAAEGSTAANPIIADSAGWFPQRYLADGTYDFQWLTAADVPVGGTREDVVIQTTTGGGGGGGGGGGNEDLYNVLSKTANYTVQPADVDGHVAFILMNPDGIPGQVGIVTISADDLGVDKAVTVVNVGSVGSVTVQPDVGETIDGDASVILGSEGRGQTFVCIGAAGWRTASSTTIGVPTGGTTGQYLKKNSGTNYDMSWATFATVREVLTGNRTYYVRSDGSDSNNGLTNTSGGAFATIQKAVNVALGLDFAGFTVTIQVGDSTSWTASTTIYAGVGILDATKFVIQGNSGSPSSVRINTTSANCFILTEGSMVTIKDMELRTTTSGACINAVDGAYFEYSNMIFGACGGAHISMSNGSKGRATGNYTVNGAATGHINVSANACMSLGAVTITFSGTPAITSGLVASGAASISAGGASYSGTYTGADATATTNGVILGGSSFPGSGSTSTATGGQIT